MMVQPLITRNIPAEFLTNNHYVFGQIKVTNTGLMGVLSDANSSYVEINDASMARILKPDKIIDYAPLLWIVKPRLTAVILSKTEYVGTASLARGGYSRLSQYPVRLTTPVYEVSGTLEWSGRLDFSVVIGEGSNAFLILYDAVVSATLFPALHMECPALLLNRKVVDSMVYQKKTTQDIS
jgi:hypothetical protein